MTSFDKLAIVSEGNWILLTTQSTLLKLLSNFFRARIQHSIRSTIEFFCLFELLESSSGHRFLLSMEYSPNNIVPPPHQFRTYHPCQGKTNFRIYGMKRSSHDRLNKMPLERHRRDAHRYLCTIHADDISTVPIYQWQCHSHNKIRMLRIF